MRSANIFDELSKYFTTTAADVLERVSERIVDSSVLLFGQEWYQQLYTTFMAFAVMASVLVLIVRLAIVSYAKEPAKASIMTVKEFFETFLMAYILTVIIQSGMIVLDEVAKFFASLPGYFEPEYEEWWVTLGVIVRNVINPTSPAVLNIVGGVAGGILEGQIVMMQYGVYAVIMLVVAAYAFRNFTAGEVLLRIARSSLWAILLTKVSVVAWLSLMRWITSRNNVSGNDAVILVMAILIVAASIALGIFLLFLTIEWKHQKKVKVEGGKLDKVDQTNGRAGSSEPSPTDAARARQGVKPAAIEPRRSSYSGTTKERAEQLKNTSEVTARNARRVALVSNATAAGASVVATVVPHPVVKAAAATLTGVAVKVGASAEKTANAAEKIGDAADKVASQGLIKTAVETAKASQPKPPPPAPAPSKTIVVHEKKGGTT